VGKHEEKISAGRTRRRWEDNIEMNLEEIEWGCMDWIELPRDRDRAWGPVVR
jgi:hypothetical protein